MTAFKRAQAYDTASRRLARAEEAVHESVRQRYVEKQRALRGKLDAEALSIVEAAELARAKQASAPRAGDTHPSETATNDTEPPAESEPQLSANLTREPEPMAKPIEGSAERKAGRR